MKSDLIPRFVIIIIVGITLPLLLIPVVAITQNSEFVEEFAKLAFILIVILQMPSLKLRLLAGAVFGLVYGISESMFIVASLPGRAATDIITERLYLTIPMHISTILLMTAFGSWKRNAILVGFALGIIIHLLFNTVVPSWVLR